MIEIDPVYLVVIHLFEILGAKDLQPLTVRKFEKLLLVDRLGGFLQPLQQGLDNVVAHIADLERDIRQVFKHVDTQHILDIVTAVIVE